MSALWRNPKHDLQQVSKEVFEASLATSLSLAVFLFLAFPSVPRPEPPRVGASDVIQIADIPNTDQQKRPPMPQRPMIPVPTEDESVPEEVTIPDTEPVLDDWAPPAPSAPGGGFPANGSPAAQTTWEEAPILVKMVVPEYPLAAKRRGIEGRVTVEMVIDEKGHVVDALVLDAAPPDIFEAAAVDAVLKWRFRPARKGDRPIRVRMAWPILFSVKGPPRR